MRTGGAERDLEFIPDFATHYFMPNRRPFDNLFDLEDAKAVEVMNALTAERLEGKHQRLFGLALPGHAP